MRKALSLVFLLLIGGMVASAAVFSCTDSAIQGNNVLVGGFSCQWGDLLFSNFAAVNMGGVPTPQINIGQGTVVGSTLYLPFNPNLAPTSGSADLWFTFTVTGTLRGLDLANAGYGGTSIQERACTVPMSGGVCTGTVGNLIAGDNASMSISYSNSGTTYIWKDLNAAEGSHLTGFTESFTVPEPVTMVLIGSGLLGLGFIRRRAKKG